MKYIFLFFLVFISAQGFSQDHEEEKPKIFGGFSQYEISIPFQGNKNRGEVFPDGSKNNSWFVPEGVNINFGYGIHFEKWIGISANTGIGMMLSEKLVMTPVFSSLRIMPKISSESHIGIDVSLGKTFALGRGNLTGDYKKIKFIFENDGFQIFIDIISYGINIHNSKNTGSLSIGIAEINF